MPVSVDWGSQVITVPQSYLTFVSGTTYQMDVADFRLKLKNLEDDLQGGIPYPDTHNHIAPVTLSGTTYARFVEIINGYTITFEDGLYQVNLSGANNNIVDVLNRNSVSVVANNSSGLIASEQLEYSSYQNQITIDTVRGVSGTSFPIGTVGTPTNNIVDALVIAASVGITRLFFKNDHTIASGVDVSDYELVGEAPSKVTLTFTSSSITDGIEVFNAQVQGELDNFGGLTNCHILDVIEVSDATGIEMNIHDCIIEGTMTVSAGSTGELQIFNSKSGYAGQSTPIIDMNGSALELIMRDFTGGIQLDNLSGSQDVSMDISSGQVIFDSTCTDATAIVRGMAKITNNASGNPNFTLIDETVASMIWDKVILDHIDSGTFGEKIGKKLLTTGKFIALK